MIRQHYQWQCCFVVARKKSPLTLAQLPVGRRACIVEVDGEEDLRDRMHALGLRAGREVAVVRKAGRKGPLHIRVGSTDLVMRRREAKLVRLSEAKNRC